MSQVILDYKYEHTGMQMAVFSAKVISELQYLKEFQCKYWKCNKKFDMGVTNVRRDA